MKLKNIMLMALILVTISIIIFLILNSSKKVNPTDMIKSKINLSLPTSSEIINYKYSKRSDSFYAKILIKNEDIESVKNSLLTFFKYEYAIYNEKEIPLCENSVEWWDMDKDSIEVCYFKAAYGKQRLFRSSPKTIEIWAFVVKQNDENYFLYIAY